MVTVNKLIKNVPVVNVWGRADREVSDLYIDSRLVSEGDAFVALSGSRSDGHSFLTNALKAGASALFFEQLPEGVSIETSKTTFVQIDDTKQALPQLALSAYGNPSQELTVLGITGTNGKTTISYLLEGIFRAAGLSSGVMGTINHRYLDQVFQSVNTTPGPAELQRFFRKMADVGVSVCALEVSSHGLFLGRVEGVSFDVGIFTNLSQDHLDLHSTMDDYFEAKALLFETFLPRAQEHGKVPVAVVNLDNSYGIRIRNRARVPVLGYSMYNPEAQVYAKKVQLGINGIRASLMCPEGSLQLTSSLVGRFNLENILAALTAGLAIGLPGEVCIHGIEQVSGIPGRLERVKGPSGTPAVFVDYAHTPEALSTTLDALRQFPHRRLVTVFGAGGDRDCSKRSLMGQSALEGSDDIWITSDNPRSEEPGEVIAQIAEGITGLDPVLIEGVCPDMDSVGLGTKRCFFQPDRKLAILNAINNSVDGDIVLLAGKGHETYQVVGSTIFYHDDRREAEAALYKRETN